MCQAGRSKDGRIRLCRTVASSDAAETRAPYHTHTVRKETLRMPSRLLNQTIADLRPAADSTPPYDGIESRRSLRVELPFPATVRGVDVDGERFTMDSVLDNLSAGGLYLRLARPIKRGMKLFIVVRLSTCGDPEVPAARVALQGVVLRAEPQPDGRCGIAVAFERHRFLYAVAS